MLITKYLIYFKNRWQELYKVNCMYLDLMLIM